MYAKPPPQPAARRASPYLVEVGGTANTIDGNVGTPTPDGALANYGIRFTADGNYYGDNRLAAGVPFDLGGTVQTDWGGNVGY